MKCVCLFVQMEDSNIQSAATLIRRDSEQSTDSTEPFDVSVQSSTKSMKETAYKKQPPGLPNIQVKIVCLPCAVFWTCQFNECLQRN